MSDPFETLGLEPRFELDLALLESRQRELGRALHPDRHAASGASGRRQALSRAIEVNDAVRVMKDPVRRAQALLARHGIELGERDEGAQASPDFLMEVLEQRDELLQAQRAKDAGRAEKLERVFQGRQSALLGELGTAFAQLSSRSSWTRGDVEPVAKKLGELRFVRRLLDEARTIQDELL